MPYLRLQISAQPDAALSAAAAEALTDLTARLLGKRREVTSVSVEAIAPEAWFIDGKCLARHGLATFYLEIKVTQGTNTKDEKARYVEAVFAAMEALLGPVHPASYVVVQEVSADAWGYGGRTQEYRFIQGRAP